ncbi:Regulator of nonsense transcripts 1 homolog [Gryllus bimaculatus]|nr:Regulator of nonsense transcripts 1 homolog [Gryllus bimaculatus]
MEESTSKNSGSKYENVDIEDTICTKKRKLSEESGFQRKKLHLSKFSTRISPPNVPKTCNLCGTQCESKENCSGCVNIGRTSVSTLSNNCGKVNSSDEFLQMIHKPKTLNFTARNTEIVSSNNKRLKVVKVESDDKEISSKVINEKEKILQECLSITESNDENRIKNVTADKTDNSRQTLSNEFDGLLDDWDLEEAFCANNVGDLSLDEWQRCEIVEVHEEVPSRNTILQLRSVHTNAVTKCVLRGVWTSNSIKPGSIVSVKAHFDSSLCAWTIDNDGGFIVEFSDILISPTSIVGSVSCLRQGVLNFLYSRNSHSVDENSKLLATGSLVHELLQQIMSQGTDSPECIAALVEEIISSSYNVRLLYASKMSLHEAREELLKVVPSIQKFCQRYSFGERTVGNMEKNSTMPQSTDKDAWEGEIKSVIAVEDNYWIPELGLKGKVDITVKAKEKHQSQNQIMPIELKTGAAKNSVEHRGQVILYCLMAAQVSPNVSGGLLVYLREGFARKVEVGRPEQRDIVMLRNRLARYIAPFYSSQQESNDKEFPLPRPTNNSRVCEWCPQKLVCSAFLSMSGGDLTKSSAQDLRSACIKHLSHEHLNYVVHWSNLLWLEEKDKSRNALTDLWSIPAEKREAKGRCLCNLQLNEPVKFKDVDSYSHVFRKNNEGKFDTNSSQISSGSMVLVSTDCRVAIAFGIIEDFNSLSVRVDIPRDLSQVGELYGNSFKLDLYEPQSFLHWVLGNLAALLEDTETASKLRRLLIDRELPSFDPSCDNSSEVKQNSQFTLNDSQQKAIKMALKAKDYLLLRGLPGTGKSTTIAILIQQFVSQGQSVLLTAHTHSAVDTVLLKLLKLEVPFMRIGSHVRVQEAIHPWTEHSLTKHCSTPEQLEDTYKKQTVVAATCLGIKHAMFTRRSFDVCIVDESTQVLQPVILGPLLHAKKFILVGDPQQLPPVVRSSIASERGLSKCLFSHLARPESTASLDFQYRMNCKITDLANDLTYGGKLKCASPAVAEATLQLANEKIQDCCPPWMTKALSCKLEDSVVFLNVPKTQEKVTDCINKEEALIVKQLIELFLKADVDSTTIGVMAPYRNQVKYIISIMQDIPGIETNTVDQYQGRDKDIVIFSCTNNWSSNNTSNADSCILNDERRLTVAITRARFKLIIIGDVSALQCFAPLKHIINSLDNNNNIVQVPDC